MWGKADGTQERVKIGELFITENLERVPAESAGPGEIIAIAGIPEITIGETLTDLEDPRTLPVIHIDEPSLSITNGFNTSPMAGQEGTQPTARPVTRHLYTALVDKMRTTQCRARGLTGGSISSIAT